MDGGFDGPRTAEAARENGFDAHFTMLSGSKAMGSAADFQLDDENRSVLECPNKAVPEESHYLEKSQSISVQMKTSACAECPKRSECPAGRAFDRLAVDAAKKAQEKASSEGDTAREAALSPEKSLETESPAENSSQAAASSDAGKSSVEDSSNVSAGSRKSDTAGSAAAYAEDKASADTSSAITLKVVVEDGRVYVNGEQLPELFRFSLKVSSVTRARRQRALGTEEAKAFGRKRNGVEATPSYMRRKIRIGRTPNSKMYRVGMHAGCGYMSLNATKYRRHLIRGAKSAQNHSKCV